MKRLKNNKGAVLIISYVVLFALVTLSAGVALLNFGELNYARRYYNSAAAFWLAEAGANLFMKNIDMLDEKNPQTFSYGGGKIILARDDSDPTQRTVTSTGIIRGGRRSIQIAYSSHTPEVFKNTISVKGNIVITGDKSAFIINDKIRLSGRVVNEAARSNMLIEDKREGVNPLLVSLTYPDMNKNGQSDEFEDFVEFNREMIAKYPQEAVLYIKSSGPYILASPADLEGKKIVYIEGGQGEGDVVIPFNGILEKGQNVTVISTGTVTYNQGGKMPADSQLNIIAWSGYAETAILPGTHKGVIFTHGSAVFDNIYDSSIANGNIIANGGMTIREVWSTKIFNYTDTRTKGVVPPGFEGLIAGSTSGYKATPSSWREIQK